MATGQCKYSGMFGEPGKGAHSIRVGGFAIVDLLLTAALALLISRPWARGAGAFLLAFLVLMVIAVGAHELFCVNTRLNALLFGRPWPDKKAVGPQ